MRRIISLVILDLRERGVQWIKYIHIKDLKLTLTDPTADDTAGPTPDDIADSTPDNIADPITDNIADPATDDDAEDDNPAVYATTSWQNVRAN